MSGGIGDESVLRRLILQMNAQMPSRRVSLRRLLDSAEPGYEGRDGAMYAIDPEELKMIVGIVAELGLYDVRLPIVLMADASHEQSTWRVEGRAECAIVSRLLGREPAEAKDRIFLYAPHVAILRRRLPTAIACAFMP